MGFEKDVKLIGKRFEVANIGHVIAKLKSIDNSGLVAVSVVRPMWSLSQNKKSRVDQS
jgi:peptidyl-prolyl cis-trans isomerase D